MSISRGIKGQTQNYAKTIFFDKKKLFSSKKMIEIDLYMSEPTYTDRKKKLLVRFRDLVDRNSQFKQK